VLMSLHLLEEDIIAVFVVTCFVEIAWLR